MLLQLKKGSKELALNSPNSNNTLTSIETSKIKQEIESLKIQIIDEQIKLDAYRNALNKAQQLKSKGKLDESPSQLSKEDEALGIIAQGEIYHSEIERLSQDMNAIELLSLSLSADVRNLQTELAEIPYIRQTAQRLGLQRAGHTLILTIDPVNEIPKNTIVLQKKQSQVVALWYDEGKPTSQVVQLEQDEIKLFPEMGQNIELSENDSNGVIQQLVKKITKICYPMHNFRGEDMPEYDRIIVTDNLNQLDIKNINYPTVILLKTQQQGDYQVVFVNNRQVVKEEKTNTVTFSSRMQEFISGQKMNVVISPNQENYEQMGRVLKKATKDATYATFKVIKFKVKKKRTKKHSRDLSSPPHVGKTDQSVSSPGSELKVILPQVGDTNSSRLEENFGLNSDKRELKENLQKNNGDIRSESFNEQQLKAMLVKTSVTVSKVLQPLKKAVQENESKDKQARESGDREQLLKKINEAKNNLQQLIRRGIRLKQRQKISCRLHALLQKLEVNPAIHSVQQQLEKNFSELEKMTLELTESLDELEKSNCLESGAVNVVANNLQIYVREQEKILIRIGNLKRQLQSKQLINSEIFVLPFLQMYMRVLLLKEKIVEQEKNLTMALTTLSAKFSEQKKEKKEYITGKQEQGFEGQLKSLKDPVIKLQRNQQKFEFHLLSLAVITDKETQSYLPALLVITKALFPLSSPTLQKTLSTLLNELESSLTTSNSCSQQYLNQLLRQMRNKAKTIPQVINYLTAAVKQLRDGVLKQAQTAQQSVTLKESLSNLVDLLLAGAEVEKIATLNKSLGVVDEKQITVSESSSSPVEQELSRLKKSLQSLQEQIRQLELVLQDTDEKSINTDYKKVVEKTQTTFEELKFTLFTQAKSVDTSLDKKKHEVKEAQNKNEQKLIRISQLGADFMKKVIMHAKHRDNAPIFDALEAFKYEAASYQQKLKNLGGKEDKDIEMITRYLFALTQKAIVAQDESTNGSSTLLETITQPNTSLQQVRSQESIQRYRDRTEIKGIKKKHAGNDPLSVIIETMRLHSITIQVKFSSIQKEFKQKFPQESEAAQESVELFKTRSLQKLHVGLKRIEELLTRENLTLEKLKTGLSEEIKKQTAQLEELGSVETRETHQQQVESIFEELAKIISLLLQPQLPLPHDCITDGEINITASFSRMRLDRLRDQLCNLVSGDIDILLQTQDMTDQRQLVEESIQFLKAWPKKIAASPPPLDLTPPNINELSDYVAWLNRVMDVLRVLDARPGSLKSDLAHFAENFKKLTDALIFNSDMARAEKEKKQTQLNQLLELKNVKAVLRFHVKVNDNPHLIVVAGRLQSSAAKGSNLQGVKLWDQTQQADQIILGFLHKLGDLSNISKARVSTYSISEAKYESQAENPLQCSWEEQHLLYKDFIDAIFKYSVKQRFSLGERANAILDEIEQNSLVVAQIDSWVDLLDKRVVSADAKEELLGEGEISQLFTLLGNKKAQTEEYEKFCECRILFSKTYVDIIRFLCGQMLHGKPYDLRALYNKTFTSYVYLHLNSLNDRFQRIGIKNCLLFNVNVILKEIKGNIVLIPPAKIKDLLLNAIAAKKEQLQKNRHLNKIQKDTAHKEIEKMQNLYEVLDNFGEFIRLLEESGKKISAQIEQLKQDVEAAYQTKEEVVEFVESRKKEQQNSLQAIQQAIPAHYLEESKTDEVDVIHSSSAEGTTVVFTGTLEITLRKALSPFLNFPFASLEMRGTASVSSPKMGTLPSQTTTSSRSSFSSRFSSSNSSTSSSVSSISRPFSSSTLVTSSSSSTSSGPSSPSHSTATSSGSVSSSSFSIPSSVLSTTSFRPSAKTRKTLSPPPASNSLVILTTSSSTTSTMGPVKSASTSSKFSSSSSSSSSSFTSTDPLVSRSGSSPAFFTVTSPASTSSPSLFEQLEAAAKNGEIALFAHALEKINRLTLEKKSTVTNGDSKKGELEAKWPSLKSKLTVALKTDSANASRLHYQKAPFYTHNQEKLRQMLWLLETPQKKLENPLTGKQELFYEIKAAPNGNCFFESTFKGLQCLDAKSLPTHKIDDIEKLRGKIAELLSKLADTTTAAGITYEQDILHTFIELVQRIDDPIIAGGYPQDLISWLQDLAKQYRSLLTQRGVEVTYAASKEAIESNSTNSIYLVGTGLTKDIYYIKEEKTELKSFSKITVTADENKSLQSSQNPIKVFNKAKQHLAAHLLQNFLKETTLPAYVEALKQTMWGGLIEMSLISHEFKLRVVVMDETGTVTNDIGKDKGYINTLFLLHRDGGTHYNLLISSTLLQSEEDIVRVVNSTAVVKPVGQSNQSSDIDPNTIKYRHGGDYTDSFGSPLHSRGRTRSSRRARNLESSVSSSSSSSSSNPFSSSGS